MTFDEEQRYLGVGVRVQRRTRAHLRHVPALEAAAGALVRGAADPAAELVVQRLAGLRERLRRAPGWVERLAARGASPGDLGSLADLRHFPVLERDELARDWRELFDVDGDPELHLGTTSGTSGQPLLVPRSGYDGLHMWAVLRFLVARFGVTLPDRPRLVLLCALPGGLEYSVRTPQFFAGALHRISTVKPRARERLLRANPAILSSDPAGLHWLLGQALTPRPRLILSSAMPLPAATRAALASFEAPVVNYLAATETGPIAWECLVEPGRFHVFHPDVWVEAEGGLLDVTRLRDSPLPLLRYRTGDRGAVLDGACACGAAGRSIVGLDGRRPAPFLRPDGAEVDGWSLAWLFKDIPLVRFELAQVGSEDFALTVDPSLAMDLELLCGRLRLALTRLGFPSPSVRGERAVRPLPAKPHPFVRRAT